jgi:hypothetical protein
VQDRAAFAIVVTILAPGADQVQMRQGMPPQPLLIVQRFERVADRALAKEVFISRFVAFSAG